MESVKRDMERMQEENVEEEKIILVHPVLVDDTLVVQSPIGSEIWIVNVAGQRVVHRISEDVTTTITKNDFYFNEFPPGRYQVIIYQDNKFLETRIIVKQ
jgi:hypothetical protein